MRLPLVARLVREMPLELLVLQETKVNDAQFPVDDVKALGFGHIAFRGQPSYNGVAILSKNQAFKEIFYQEFGQGDERAESRHLAVELESGLCVHNFYVPSGGYEPDPITNPKFDHKLRFLNEMMPYFERLAQEGKPAVVCGDLNVAPHPQDVWSHEKMLKVVSHTPIETGLLDGARDCVGWRDQIRRDDDTQRLFSWWTYRQPDWRDTNYGRRLDHVWASANLKDHEAGSGILVDARGWEKPSDHVPVFASFDLD